MIGCQLFFLVYWMIRRDFWGCWNNRMTRFGIADWEDREANESFGSQQNWPSGFGLVWPKEEIGFCEFLWSIFWLVQFWLAVCDWIQTRNDDFVWMMNDSFLLFVGQFLVFWRKFVEIQSNFKNCTHFTATIEIQTNKLQEVTFCCALEHTGTYVFFVCLFVPIEKLISGLFCLGVFITKFCLMIQSWFFFRNLFFRKLIDFIYFWWWWEIDLGFWK